MERERIDGEDYVVCSAMANPKETDFVWSLKSDNDTLEQIAVARNGKSYIRLDTSVTNFRTYVCVANNSIGYSSPCDRDVPGMRSHTFLTFSITPNDLFRFKKLRYRNDNFMEERLKGCISIII